MSKPVTATDTEKLRRELADLNRTLEANNSALEEAQALTHLGSWQWDVATGVISWSDELYRIYGYKPQEIEVGFDKFLSLIHPEDRERVGGAIAKAYETGEPFSFEHRIILPNGKIRILNGKGKSIKQDGTIVRMLGTSQDVTEQRKADQALHLSDERFKAVTAATNDVVYDLDLHDNAMWFNEALNTEYGYPTSRKAKDKKWWLDHIHPEDRPGIERALSKLLKSKAATWEKEYRLKKDNGTYVDVRDRAFIIRDADNRPVRMIGSILDITQQKELERAKDKFISLVSHQLRTPLTSMRITTEMLTGGYIGKLSEEQQENMLKISKSTERMIRLVGDILNVSQIERGRLKVVPVPTDVPALIKWHIDEVAPLAADLQIKIAYTVQPNLDTVNVDPVLFSQIIHNLLINAIRYTNKPKTRITVAFKKNANGYLLSVKDQGIGIPKQVQSQIFTSFFRADNAVKTNGDGTGLGLYLIKLILDTTEGAKAWFESELGKGTTFYVQLPAHGMDVSEGDKTLQGVV